MKVLVATLGGLWPAALAVFASHATPVHGALPKELVRGETRDAFVARLAQALGPVDEIAVTDCRDRAFELKQFSQVAANDPLLVELSKGRSIWHLRFEGTGCGPARTYNLYLFDQSNAPVQIVATLPRDTAASFKLQSDAFHVVAPAARGYAPKDCPTRPVVIATTIVDRPNGTSPWSEIWTFRSCSMDIRFRVTFTPDATGAGISARRE